MVQIPDAYTALGTRALPDVSRPVASYNGGQVGAAVEQLGQDVNEVYKQQAELNYGLAKSNYLNSMVQFAKQEEDNPDYAGTDQRWQAASKAALESQLKNLPGPYAAKLQADAGDYTYRIYSSVLQQAEEKRKQDDVGKTIQAAQNNLAAAINAPNDEVAQQIINQTNELLKGPTSRTSWSLSHEIDQRNRWIQDYGKAKVDSFLSKGDAQGAQDWYNQHYGLVGNPQDTQKINSAVVLPRSDMAAIRIMNGGGVANTDALAQAQEQAESGGIQSAVSGKGAVGVMQLMPAAAQQAATALGLPYDPERLKTDEVYNRTLGNEYRNEMLARYAGNQTLALAAYNAGPGTVDKWLRQYGNPNTGQVSDAEWLSKIPYAETRDYVSKINAKVPPSPGANTQQGWTDLANQLPPSIREATGTAIATRVNAQRNEAIQQQTAAADTLFKGVQQGQITDPSHLQQPELQTAWTLAQPDLQRAVLHAVNEAGSRDVKEYGKGFYDLFKAIHAPNDDPNRIADPTQLYKHIGPNGDLTMAGYEKLKNEIANKGTPEGEAESQMKKQFFEYAKGQITGEALHLGVQDPKGQQLFVNFMAAALPAYEKGRAEGKTPAQLLSSDSPDYIGKAIKTFQRPNAQWVSDLTNEAAPPRTLSSIISDVRSKKISEAEGKAEAIKLGFVKEEGPQVPMPE